MKERKRYIDIKVINMDRKRNEKNRDIYVNTQDGKGIVIQDGATVAALEEVYSNLMDAVEPIYALVKDNPDKPARLVSREHRRYDVTKMSDFYYKDAEPEKEKTEEKEPKKRGRTKKAELIEAMA